MTNVIVHFEKISITTKVPFTKSEGYTIYKAFETYPEAKEIILL